MYELKDRIEVAWKIISETNREVIINQPKVFVDKFIETKRTGLIKEKDQKVAVLDKSRDEIIRKYKNPRTCPPVTQDPHRDLGPSFKDLAVQARLVIQELMKKNADIHDYEYKDEIVSDFTYDKDAAQGAVKGVAHLFKMFKDNRFTTMCEDIRKKAFNRHLATINERTGQVAGIVNQMNVQGRLSPLFRDLVGRSIRGAMQAFQNAIAGVEICKKPAGPIGDAKALAAVVARNFNNVNWVIRPLSWRYINRMRVVSGQHLLNHLDSFRHSILVLIRSSPIPSTST